LTENISPLVVAENLTRTFRMGTARVEALRGVSLEINPGEFIAIMGPSGSGKSTLLNIIGCLEWPTSGSLFLFRENILSLSDAELSLIRAQRIGFVFQTYNLIHQLSVLENVEMPFIYQDVGRREARARARRAIEEVGLEQRLLHRPPELSGGELQRVAVARALAVHPILILADEPTGNLDSATGDGIMKLMSSLNRQGATIVLVTHDTRVADYARRKLYLYDGRLVREPR